jgi:hypothetical protein
VLRIDGREVVLDRILVTHVSLAVMLMDSYTNIQAIGRVRVLLKEPAQEGRLNPSGYFLFLDIAPYGRALGPSKALLQGPARGALDV